MSDNAIMKYLLRFGNNRIDSIKMGERKYKRLFKKNREQESKEVFAHFPYDGKSGETWESPFAKLAKMAKKEDWNFKRKEFVALHKNQSFPILTNYLNYTFLRLQDEGKITLTQEEDKACFNTGLQTPRGKDIFATFFRNRQSESKAQTDWTFYGFFDSYSEKLESFHQLPEIAHYIDNVEDLVFKDEYKIESNLDHFLDKNKERLPEALQGNMRMAENVINGSIQALQNLIRRNYKIAIPHWYENKIQLLLPLVLTNEEGIADLALVVDRDDVRKIYRGKTILTMDQAYVDARLITKPADEWLNP